MNTSNRKRASHEIIHGKKLALAEPESAWGWSTPAGKLRAQWRAALIFSGAKLGPGTTALEVGCGTGLFTEIFAQTGAKIVAVDISPDLLAQAHARGLPPTVQFMERHFEDCAVEGPFDAVIGSSVLHHLEIQPALRKIYELLKPGGLMSFAEPNMLNPQIMIQKNIPWVKERMGDSPDETAFFRWQIYAHLQRVGFINIQVTPRDWLHPATPSNLIPLISRLGKRLEHIPIAREFAGSLYIRCCRPLLRESESC